MNKRDLSGVSRRDFLRVSKRFGLSSTLLALGGMAGTITLPQLAKAAESTYQKRFSKEPRHTLRHGAAGFNARNLMIERTGILEFIRDIEERTDGEIRIEFIGDNQICGQLDCVSKTQEGIVDLFSASTQNSAGGAPHYNVLDYAYMFPSRASQYHFFYHPISNTVFREPLERRHGIKFLFTHCELRGIMLGNTWRDRPTVTSVTDIAGTRNRVTGTQLGRIAMELMKLNPAPIAWEETLDGLRQGLIDGAETWASAVAYANMTPVVSQCVDLRFFCGTEHTAMSAESFDRLDGDLQDAVMESAYLAQIAAQYSNEAALVNTVGFSDPQKEGTIFAKHGVRVAFLSPEARREAEEMCSPEFVPGPWEQWRERINAWADGVDTYTEIHRVAREIPVDMLAENVEPRRWWRT
ncbi:TRAP transporter substrate-binding protein [Faunimonas sp. B44]|uniref:TRAP transporter substrate-binding protein n=1 Tax=Faunimonas sp. B44 TaxID=3461493 RepID=UPI004044E88E